MNKEERIKYLEEHQDEVDAQIKRMIEDDGEKIKSVIELISENNVLMGKPPITHEQWNRNFIYSRVEGENTNDEPTVDGIDLTPYLDMIRYDRIIEHLIILYIKDGAVIETKMIDGDSSSVGNLEETFSSLMHAKELGAAYYSAHNHPPAFVAKPSSADMKCIERLYNQAKSIGAEIADYAVVTIDDYYSYKKSLDK